MERLYLDTSVFGGYFEPEFELWTKVLFDKISKGEYKIIYSRLTDTELSKAPDNVKALSNNLQESNIEFVDVDIEVTELAEKYIIENVVGKSNRADCIHIALATVNNADILVSWNFRHIVNINKIRGYNSVNYKNGYKILEIRTPREILEYED